MKSTRSMKSLSVSFRMICKSIKTATMNLTQDPGVQFRKCLYHRRRSVVLAGVKRMQVVPPRTEKTGTLAAASKRPTATKTSVEKQILLLSLAVVKQTN